MLSQGQQGRMGPMEPLPLPRDAAKPSLLLSAAWQFRPVASWMDPGPGLGSLAFKSHPGRWVASSQARLGVAPPGAREPLTTTTGTVHMPEEPPRASRSLKGEAGPQWGF